MLFVKAIKLCTVLAFTSYAYADEDETSQSETTEEAGTLLKFITENASSVSLIKEIADALEKEEADVGKGETKKSLRWGDAVPYKMSEPSSTSRAQPFPTDEPKTNPNLGQHSPQSHDVYNTNDVFKNINGLYHKDVEIYNPPFIDNTPSSPTKDAVQNYVDNLLTHQNVPALLLHISLAGLQQNEKTLQVSFPVNVNFNNDKKEANIDSWNKRWNLNAQNIDKSRPLLPLRSDRGASEEKDIGIAKAIVDKIKKSKPGRLLFTDMENRNKTDSE